MTKYSTPTPSLIHFPSHTAGLFIGNKETTARHRFQRKKEKVYVM